jgi:hypothetical protein
VHFIVFTVKFNERLLLLNEGDAFQ